MFDTLSEKLQNSFQGLRGRSKISSANIEDAIKQVRTALLEADVNFKIVKSFIEEVKAKALGEKVLRGVDPGQQFVKILQDELTKMMGETHSELNIEGQGPRPVLIVGLNGAGKTTFTSKLALQLKDKKQKKVLLAPADNFRPAAKDQLQTLAAQIGVECFDSDLSLAPVDIATLAMKHARENNFDVVLIDTAGRLQVDQNLMGQLVHVKESLDAPQVLFVADAMTGQQAVDVAQTFHSQVGLTGVVLSKMDSDARGGAALSIRHSTGVPILFLSTGERPSDLEPFYPDRIASRILDMGDVVTLVEKAQEQIDEKEAEKLMNKIEKNTFSLDDFVKQMEMLGKMGPLESLMKMIPGMGGMLRQAGDLSSAKKEMKQMKVMVSSMTLQERKDHKLLNDSRKTRVAKGSGYSVGDLDQFLKKFEKMQKMMSGMASFMKGGGMPGAGGAGTGIPTRRDRRAQRAPSRKISVGTRFKKR